MATNLSTNVAAAGMTNAPGFKPGDMPKPVEIVFVLDGDHVRSAPVTRGISDDNYTEITDGLKEGDEVVSGRFTRRLTGTWTMARKPPKPTRRLSARKQKPQRLN